MNVSPRFAANSGEKVATGHHVEAVSLREAGIDDEGVDAARFVFGHPFDPVAHRSKHTPRHVARGRDVPHRRVLEQFGFERLVAFLDALIPVKG